MLLKYTLAAGLGVVAMLAGGTASADSIDPTTFSADLGVGDSVTVRKTVEVSAGGPTEAVVDAFFLIDTSGSMGAEIDAAKTAAADIFTALSGFGNAAAGVGVFAENAGLVGDPCTTPCTLPGGIIAAPGAVINQDITTDSGAFTTAVGNVTLGTPDGGGDSPESSNTGIDLVANNASFRPGSNRFIFVFGDASAKGTADADVIASLVAAGADLIGLNFGGTSFANDILDLGGTVYASTASAAAIVADITAGITSGFSSYSSVTVGDLGGGLPEIGVSTTCISADIGSCVGADATGTFDRSVDRTFEFDVTFTRLADGGTAFDTYALVDGGIVATESDVFGGDGMAAIPLPAAGWLLIGALGGLVAVGRRRR